ncbi:ORF6N domain-containing protein [Bacillus spizizenii]|nr:ORF6N domain-containing protein [Bacillus spizizenii]
MGAAVTINNVDLTVKEYQSQRVITFKEMDALHGRKTGTAKRNFFNNRDKLIENEDFYLITLKEFRELYTPNDTAKRGNPTLETVLLTEMGYLMLVKTLTDPLAWQVQRALVSNYFRFQQSAAQQQQSVMKNEFDIMRKMLDVIEEQRAREEQTHLILQEMQEDIQHLQVQLLNAEELNKDVITSRLLKASDIAHQMKLYSVSGLPHNRIIGAIAKKLGFKTNVKNYYEDDYIVIMREGEEESHLTWQTYYKPAGADRIINWFNSNRKDIYYETYYKNKSKHGNAGDLREAGYRVGGVNWAIAT